jgi:hypothetical protein
MPVGDMCRRVTQELNGRYPEADVKLWLGILINYLNRYPSVGVIRFDLDMAVEASRRGLRYGEGERRLTHDILRVMARLGIVDLTPYTVTLRVKPLDCTQAAAAQRPRLSGASPSEVRGVLARFLADRYGVEYFTARLILLDIQQLVELKGSVSAVELPSLLEGTFPERYSGFKDKALFIINEAVRLLREAGLIKVEGGFLKPNRAPPTVS